MEKITKKYNELNEIQKLKISKIFLYQKLDMSVKENSNIVFEGSKMVYLIVGEEMIDL